MARTVAKMGAENINAVTSASGVMERAKKNAIMQVRFNTPRRLINPKRRVLSGAHPSLINHGRTMTNPNSSRKNAISNGCRSPETWRTAACMALMQSVNRAIHRMPRRLSRGGGAGVCSGMGA